MRLTGGVKLTYGVRPRPRQGAPPRQGAAARGLRRHAARPAPRPCARGSPSSTASSPWRARARAAASPRSWTRCSPPATAVALDVALADRTAHERRAVYTVAAAASARPASTSTTRTVSPATPSSRTPPSSRSGATCRSCCPPSLHRLARNLITARPRLVKPDACIRCNECAAICGARAIAMDPLPDYDDSALRALLRMHGGLPHGGHRQRVAAARPPVLARPLTAPPPAGTSALPTPPTALVGARACGSHYR